MRRHPLPIAILTYSVMVFVIYCLCLIEAQSRVLRKLQPIPWYYDYPYKGKLRVEYMLPQELHLRCAQGQRFPSSYRIFGCSYPAFLFKKDASEDDISECLIIFPLDIGIFDEEDLDYLWRHEQAHCNGWTGQHPPDLFYRLEKDREAIELWVIKRSMGGQ